jgi:putative glycosyltransferase (TIGR04348 family)
MSLSKRGSSGTGLRVTIVTPGTREANNGNWRTARRWAGFLAGMATPIVQSEWDGEPADLMIALHARRSAASIAALKARFPQVPLALILSGTDLYRDLPASEQARRSLELADRIVALQDDAVRYVPARLRGKCRVIYQSSPALRPARKAKGRLDAVAVGHLRGEKDPKTLMDAVRLLEPSLPVRVRHIGAALDPALGRAARATMAADHRYRWVGPLPHGFARAAIRDAHVLVHPSLMEGGANVIAESVMAGTPVVASRMSGNIGMLGANYPGYFEVGDASGLARCLARCLREPAYYRSLVQACRNRRARFAPAAERQAVRALFRELTAGRER